MPKKKTDNKLKKVAEAIYYLKSCRENAPLNPRLSEDLRSLEDAYHNELCKLVLPENLAGEISITDPTPQGRYGK